MRFERSTCLLRPLVDGDAEALTRHANDVDVARNLRDAFPHPYTLADAHGYIVWVAASPMQRNFGIIIDGEAVGCVTLVLGSDIERKSAEIGYWIGKVFWNRGVMTEAVRVVTRYGLDELRLNRVFAVPFTGNAASIRMLEKAGYAREGLMRASAVRNGEVIDQVMMAIVAERPTAT